MKIINSLFQFIAPYLRKTTTNETSIESIKRTTDKFSVDPGITQLDFAIRSTAPVGPYLRWCEGDTYYQLRLTDTGIIYQQYSDGSWRNVWTK